MYERPEIKTPGQLAHSNLSTRSDLAEALGHICAEWANLEWHLYELFEELSGSPPSVAYATFTSIESNRGKRSLVLSMAKAVVQDATLYQELDAILAKIGRCAKQRNALVHSVWVIPYDRPDQSAQIRFKEGESARNFVEVSASDVKETEAKIKASTDQVRSYRLKIAPMLRPWLEKLHAQPSVRLEFSTRSHPPGMKKKGHHSQR